MPTNDRRGGLWDGALFARRRTRQQAPPVFNYGNTAAGQAQSMWDDYEAAQQEARAANEARYAELKTGYQDRYNRGIANLEGLGQQEIADATASYDRMGSRGQASLVSRGLAGTTVSGTMRAGNEREKQSAIGRINASVRNQRIGLDAGLSEDKLRMIERREDTYPDINQMQGLAGAYGRYGGAGGSGGYGGYGQYRYPVGGYGATERSQRPGGTIRDWKAARRSRRDQRLRKRFNNGGFNYRVLAKGKKAPPVPPQGMPQGFADWEDRPY